MKELLHYNRHFGTKSDIQYVAQCLGLPKVVDFVPTHEYAISHGRAVELVSQPGNVISEFCSKYPVILGTDTIPDMRPFMVNPDCSKNKFIFDATNRFDWDIADVESYHQDIKGVMDRTVFVANNRYDAFKLKHKLKLPSNFSVKLIRPVGYSPLPVNEDVLNDKSSAEKVVVIDNWPPEARFSINKMNDAGVPITILGSHYGGPKTLALYKGVVILPYQISVMKLIENLHAGVTHFIPSREFYVTFLGEGQLTRVSEVFHIAGWHQYHDYYNDEMYSFMYTFDSWEQLKKMVEGDLVMDDRVQRGMEWAKKNRKNTLDIWKDIFGNLGFQLSDNAKCPVGK